MSSDFKQQINQRVGHIAVSYRGKLLVWGGYMFSDPLESETYHHATYELFVYDAFAELWECKLLKGDIPPLSSGGCGVILGDTLYVFGGVVKSVPELDGTANDLYALNLITLTWTHLRPEGIQPSPSEKLVGWEHGGRIYFFGGFGPIPDRHVFFQYVIDDETGSAWNNQFFGYNPQTNTWEWPYVHGDPPCPRAAHAGDKSGPRVFISGGRLKTVRRNDLYVLDMDTMIWSGNINESVEYVPPGRSWHSFTFISPHRAVLYGGFSTFNNVSNDCWFVDITCKEADGINGANKWEVRYTLPPHGQRFCLRRFWHKTVYLEKTGDLICFGGFNRFNNPPLITVHGANEEHGQDQDSKPDHTNVMLAIHFKPLTLLRLSLNATLKHHKKNKNSWETLPQSLQALLTRRFSQIYSIWELF